MLLFLSLLNLSISYVRYKYTILLKSEHCAEKYLFKKALIKKDMTLHHPAILALQNGLEKKREKIDESPKSFIRIILQVQTGVENYKVSGAARSDGSLVVLGDFKVYVKDYHNKTMSVKFNM